MITLRHWFSAKILREMWGGLGLRHCFVGHRESMVKAGLSKIVIGPRIGGIRLHTLEKLLKPLSSPPSVHKGLSKQTAGLAGMRLQADGFRWRPYRFIRLPGAEIRFAEVVLCIERARLDPGHRLKSAQRSPKILLAFVDEPQSDVTER
jgi:hypothetical protein